MRIPDTVVYAEGCRALLTCEANGEIVSHALPDGWRVQWKQQCAQAICTEWNVTPPSSDHASLPVVAVLKTPDWRDSTLTSARTVSTTELDQRLSALDKNNIACVIQRYVKSKGPKASVYRVAWRRDRAGSALHISHRYLRNMQSLVDFHNKERPATKRAAGYTLSSVPAAAPVRPSSHASAAAFANSRGRRWSSLTTVTQPTDGVETARHASAGRSRPTSARPARPLMKQRTWAGSSDRLPGLQSQREEPGTARTSVLGPPLAAPDGPVHSLNSTPRSHLPASDKQPRKRTGSAPPRRPTNVTPPVAELARDVSSWLCVSVSGKTPGDAFEVTGRAIEAPLAIMGQLVGFLEQRLVPGMQVVVQECVAEFIKDDENQWVMTNVKSYTLDDASYKAVQRMEGHFPVQLDAQADGMGGAQEPADAQSVEEAADDRAQARVLRRKRLGLCYVGKTCFFCGLEHNVYEAPEAKPGSQACAPQPIVEDALSNAASAAHVTGTMQQPPGGLVEPAGTARSACSRPMSAVDAHRSRSPARSVVHSTGHKGRSASVDSPSLHEGSPTKKRALSVSSLRRPSSSLRLVHAADSHGARAVSASEKKLHRRSRITLEDSDSDASSCHNAPSRAGPNSPLARCSTDDGALGECERGQPLLAATVESALERGRKLSLRDGRQSMECSKKFGYDMTTQMMMYTADRLQAIGKHSAVLERLHKRLTQHMAQQGQSCRYQVHQVCKTCYLLYQAVLDLDDTVAAATKAFCVPDAMDPFDVMEAEDDGSEEEATVADADLRLRTHRSSTARSLRTSRSAGGSTVVTLHARDHRGRGPIQRSVILQVLSHAATGASAGFIAQLNSLLARQGAGKSSQRPALRSKRSSAPMLLARLRPGSPADPFASATRHVSPMARHMSLLNTMPPSMRRLLRRTEQEARQLSMIRVEDLPKHMLQYRLVVFFHELQRLVPRSRRGAAEDLRGGTSGSAVDELQHVDCVEVQYVVAQTSHEFQAAWEPEVHSVSAYSRPATRVSVPLRQVRAHPFYCTEHNLPKTLSSVRLALALQSCSEAPVPSAASQAQTQAASHTTRKGPASGWWPECVTTVTLTAFTGHAPRGASGDAYMERRELLVPLDTQNLGCLMLRATVACVCDGPMKRMPPDALLQQCAGAYWPEPNTFIPLPLPSEWLNALGATPGQHGPATGGMRSGRSNSRLLRPQSAVFPTFSKGAVPRQGCRSAVPLPAMPTSDRQTPQPAAASTPPTAPPTLMAAHRAATPASPAATMYSEAQSLLQHTARNRGGFGGTFASSMLARSRADSRGGLTAEDLVRDWFAVLPADGNARVHRIAAEEALRDIAGEHTLSLLAIKRAQWMRAGVDAAALLRAVQHSEQDKMTAEDMVELWKSTRRRAQCEASTHPASAAALPLLSSRGTSAPALGREAPRTADDSSNPYADDDFERDDEPAHTAAAAGVGEADELPPVTVDADATCGSLVASYDEHPAVENAAAPASSGNAGDGEHTWDGQRMRELLHARIARQLYAMVVDGATQLVDIAELRSHLKALSAANVNSTPRSSSDGVFVSDDLEIARVLKHVALWLVRDPGLQLLFHRYDVEGSLSLTRDAFAAAMSAAFGRMMDRDADEDDALSVRMHATGETGAGEDEVVAGNASVAALSPTSFSRPARGSLDTAALSHMAQEGAKAGLDAAMRPALSAHARQRAHTQPVPDTAAPRGKAVGRDVTVTVTVAMSAAGGIGVRWITASSGRIPGTCARHASTSLHAGDLFCVHCAAATAQELRELTIAAGLPLPPSARELHNQLASSPINSSRVETGALPTSALPVEQRTWSLEMAGNAAAAPVGQSCRASDHEPAHVASVTGSDSESGACESEESTGSGSELNNEAVGATSPHRLSHQPRAHSRPDAAAQSPTPNEGVQSAEEASGPGALSSNAFEPDSGRQAAGARLLRAPLLSGMQEDEGVARLRLQLRAGQSHVQRLRFLRHASPEEVLAATAQARPASLPPTPKPALTAIHGRQQQLDCVWNVDVYQARAQQRRAGSAATATLRQQDPVFEQLRHAIRPSSSSSAAVLPANRGRTTGTIDSQLQRSASASNGQHRAVPDGPLAHSPYQQALSGSRRQQQASAGRASRALRQRGSGAHGTVAALQAAYGVPVERERTLMGAMALFAKKGDAVALQRLLSRCVPRAERVASVLTPCFAVASM